MAEETKNKISRRKAIGIMGAAAAGLAVAVGGYSYWQSTQKPPEKPPEKPPPKPQILRLGRIPDVASLDPYKIGATSIPVYVNMLDSLLVNDVDWTKETPVVTNPGLAESYERLDDTHWRFHMRKGVKFHCGEVECNAHVAKWNFDRSLNPKKPSTDLSMIDMIKYPLQVEDDYTLLMETKYPTGLIPGIAAYTCPTAIVCPKHAEQYGDEFGATIMDGTGPFKFKEWKRGSYVRLVKNEKYWRGPPKLDELIFYVIPEGGTRLMAYNKGEIDFIMDVPTEAIPDLKKDPKTVIVTNYGVRTRWLDFNCRKKPFDDPNVRRAFSHALDRETMVKSLAGGQADVAWAYQTPAMLGYRKCALPEYNPSKAKQMLKDLGWEPGSDGILRKGGEKFSVVLVSSSDRDINDRQFAEAVGTQISAIGVEVKMNVVEFARFVVMVRDTAKWMDWDIGLMGMGGGAGDPDGMYNWAHSTQVPPTGWNVVWYSTKELDSLLERGRQSSDRQERIEVYGKMNELMARDLPRLPIYHKFRFEAMRNTVKGYVQHPTEFWVSTFLNTYIEGG